MIERIMTYASMVGMAFGVLFWAQANFVDAGDFKEYQYEKVEDEVNYLKDKETRMQRDYQELEFEDKRQLERLELKMQRMQKELGK